MTKRQEIINAVRDLTAEHGYPPTFGEVGLKVDLSQTAVRFHVKILVEGGKLRYTVGAKRSLALPAEKAAAVAGK